MEHRVAAQADLRSPLAPLALAVEAAKREVTAAPVVDWNKWKKRYWVKRTIPG